MTHGADNYLHEQWSGVQCWAATDPFQGYPITVNSGAEKTGVDFGLERGTRISGRVFDGNNGEVLPGMTVKILTAQGVPVAEVLSDGQGRYRTLPLPAGTYAAVASNHADGPATTKGKTVVATECGYVTADLIMR